MLDLFSYDAKYVIRSLRSSGFKRFFRISKTSSIKSFNMGKLVAEQSRHKIIALRQAKLIRPVAFGFQTIVEIENTVLISEL